MGEELQVEIIAVCLWRERRALRCELGKVGRAREERSEKIDRRSRIRPVCSGC